MESISQFPFHLLCIKRPKKTNSWLDFVTMSRCLFFFHVSCCTLENSEMWTEHIKLVVSKTQLDPSVFLPISFSFFEHLSTAYVSANLPYLSVIAYWVGWAKHGAKAEFSLRFYIKISINASLPHCAHSSDLFLYYSIGTPSTGSSEH